MKHGSINMINVELGRLSGERGIKMENVKEEMYTKAQHEREMTRMEVQNKRLFIALMVVLAMLFITNGCWVVYEMQYQDVYITQEADTGMGGNAQVFGAGIGDVNYGASEADDSNTSSEGIQ